MSVLDKNNTTAFERINASYYSESDKDLSPLDLELKSRWESAFTMLLNLHSREQVVKKLKQLFKISTATAYRDVANALSLYGDVHRSKKEGWRYLIFEYNMRLFQLATKKQDLSEMGKCLSRMIKLADLDKDDESFNKDKLKNINIQIAVDAPTQNALKNMFKNGSVDLNNFDATEITYEDMP